MSKTVSERTSPTFNGLAVLQKQVKEAKQLALERKAAKKVAAAVIQKRGTERAAPAKPDQ